MYIRCKDGESQYIIDTEEARIYELVEDSSVLLEMEADNFMRWHPYLEEIETTTSMPQEIRK
ncbi:MAG: hypothetical protein MJZ79_02895 [Paludibacteraceae bacterium]|nr:hypothetical protein [Paludibacteraceae bacterium]